MDRSSITAGVAWIAAPALQCAQHLRSDIQAIIDAPSDIASLTRDLLVIEQAIRSLRDISDRQWKSLGESVVSQSTNGMDLCQRSCSEFRTAIGRWTRHGEDGKLSSRDRTTIGLFRQVQIKSTSSQLRNCKETLTLIVSTATFHSSLKQMNSTDETMSLILAKETEITTAISAAEQQLVEVKTRLDELELASVDSTEDEDKDDQKSATMLSNTENAALETSLELFQELFKYVQAAAAEVKENRARTTNNITFGKYNRGVQTGVSNAPIHFTIGKDRDEQ